MAFAGTFVETFDNPAAGRNSAICDDEELLELEFSDYGRDARFLPGWYILPSIVGGVLVIVSLLV